jgi:hypothetical protein
MTDHPDDARGLAAMQQVLDEGRARGSGPGSIRQRIHLACAFVRPSLRLAFLREHKLTGRKAR